MLIFLKEISAVIPERNDAGNSRPIYSDLNPAPGGTFHSESDPG